MILIDLRLGVVGLVHRPERGLLEKQLAACALFASGAQEKAMACACDDDSIVVEVCAARGQASAAIPASEDPRPTFARLAALAWMGG